MLKKLFEPTQTVRHVPYKELKRRYVEQMRKTDLLFAITIRVSFGILAILAYLAFVMR